MSSQPEAAQTNPLRQPVQYIKGVGPSRVEQLQRLELRRACDLLFNFPRDYQDLSDVRPIGQLEEKLLQSVAGKIDEWETRNTRRGPMTTLVIESEGKYLKAMWFKMPFVQRGFAVGRRVLLSGKPKYDPPFWVMTHPKITFLSDSEDAEENQMEPILPVYSLTEGLGQHHLRNIIRPLLVELPDLIEDVLPPEFREENQLMPIADAIRFIHFPPDMETIKATRRRFIFQELFVLQLALAIRRLQHQTLLKATPLPLNPQIDTNIRQLFPYELTGAQKRVIREIAEDLRQPIPMNRLLQGDVGSGKTLVAVYAMLQAVANGAQAVFMAPTEVLAKQHLRSLQNLLEGKNFLPLKNVSSSNQNASTSSQDLRLPDSLFPAQSQNTQQVRIAPIFGGQRPAERAAVLQEIKTGQAKIIVGTQAIICGDIPFHNLGLVVIDEQHKFGVKQRAVLKTGTKFSPHYLVMTATPIPRSVTMTLFGDLDVSVIDEFPPGRQKIRTRIADEENRELWWDFVRQKLDEGRQGFVVVPLVEESENLDAKSVIEVFESLKTGPLEKYRLGCIHGRMSTEEKESIMLDFRSGEIQMLVSTTVIEVGVDVPNATLLTVESAERFGLAQLHQLRGRVGRGKHPGYCVVFVKEENMTNNEQTARRMQAFADSTDGFKLAEVDFELRGPGELFGTQQHGMPPFIIADLSRDRDVLIEARNAANLIVHADPGLAKPEHAKLRTQVLARYGKVLELGDVG
ncbi:MAG: ATP-dependent DNA helicase RecG [Thermoguttaceae bacterium]